MSGHEEDGMDETIVPVDFARSGQISDNEIWAQLVSKVLFPLSLCPCIFGGQLCSGLIHLLNDSVEKQLQAKQGTTTLNIQYL